MTQQNNTLPLGGSDARNEWLGRVQILKTLPLKHERKLHPPQRTLPSAAAADPPRGRVLSLLKVAS